MELSEQTKNARMQNWRSMRFRQWRLGAGSVVDWPKTYLRSPRLKVKKCVKRISLCAQARDGVNFDHVLSCAHPGRIHPIRCAAWLTFTSTYGSVFCASLGSFCGYVGTICVLCCA